MGLTTLRDYSIMISQNSTIPWISILDICWKIVGTPPPPPPRVFENGPTPERLSVGKGF